jgi:hypothetical protein
MREPILVVNAGSSSINFRYLRPRQASPSGAHGQVEGIGISPHLEVSNRQGNKLAVGPVSGDGHAGAIAAILDWFAAHVHPGRLCRDRSSCRPWLHLFSAGADRQTGAGSSRRPDTARPAAPAPIASMRSVRSAPSLPKRRRSPASTRCSIAAGRRWRRNWLSRTRLPQKGFGAAASMASPMNTLYRCSPDCGRLYRKESRGRPPWQRR